MMTNPHANGVGACCSSQRHTGTKRIIDLAAARRGSQVRADWHQP